MAHKGVAKCMISPEYDMAEDFLIATGLTEAIENTYGILFIAVGTLAVAGNICALYFFIKIDKRFTTSKIFYSSFAVMDLLMGIFCLNSAFVFIKGRQLISCSELSVSNFYLDFWGFIFVFTFLGASNIIAIMCFSRCISVLKPFVFRDIFTPVSCFIMVGVCGIHPFIMATLPFYKGRHYRIEHITGLPEYHFTDITGEVAFNYTTNEVLPIPIADALNITLNLVPRLFALAVILISSTIVVAKLLRSNIASSNKKSQTNAAITLIILAAIYFITYIPFCVTIIADVAGYVFDPTHKFYYKAYPAFYLIAFSSSAMNPFVYHLRGKSLFEEKQKSGRSTVLYNSSNSNGLGATTRVSVVADDKV